MLVVEDDRATAYFVRFVLADVGGANVQVYSDPAIALQTVEPGNWDAVITDIKLPSMTGSEFTRRVHRIDRYLPVITMTAFPTLANRIRSAKADSVRFLTKPVPGELLVSSVLEVVDPFGNWIQEAG
ncbi:MAG: response regulator [Acidimicrobiia bacterium]